MAGNHKISRVIVALTLLQMVCTAGAGSAPWWDDVGTPRFYRMMAGCL
jgi:hypothetical protein